MCNVNISDIAAKTLLICSEKYKWYKDILSRKAYTLTSWLKDAYTLVSVMPSIITSDSNAQLCVKKSVVHDMHNESIHAVAFSAWMLEHEVSLVGNIKYAAPLESVSFYYGSLGH